jgi:hypothetical protein
MERCERNSPIPPPLRYAVATDEGRCIAQYGQRVEMLYWISITTEATGFRGNAFVPEPGI